MNKAFFSKRVGLKNSVETTQRTLDVAIILLIFVLLLTRTVTLKHGMFLHPDEDVFYIGADNLKSYLLGWASEFEEVKPYPEGAYVFQVPFHIAFAVLEKFTGNVVESQLIGRISAVFYFVLGVIVSCKTIYRFLSNRPAGVVLYLLIAIFSIMHIEQSRYGTGDAISFFLIMLVVYISGMSLEKHHGENKRKLLLFLAFYITGALCAVKYPLLFFALIPAWAANKSVCSRRKRLLLLVFFLSSLVGFSMFSPKATIEPMRIIESCTEEIRAYIREGNTEMGGPINHLLSIGVYVFLYSGLPLGPVLLLTSMKRSCAQKDKSEVNTFFYTTLPVIFALFLIYNLFIKNLFMRTMYPFFFFVDMYVAVAAGNFVYRGGIKRVSVILLIATMIIRGAWLMSLLTYDPAQERLTNLIDEAVDENWEVSTGLHLRFMVMPKNEAELINKNITYIEEERWQEEKTAEMEKGELVITGAMDFSQYDNYIIPLKYSEHDEIKNQRIKDIQNWQNFKDVNEKYYVGSLYPDWHYYVLGNWVKGTTGTDYEFPSMDVYYCK